MHGGGRCKSYGSIILDFSLRIDKKDCIAGIDSPSPTDPFQGKGRVKKKRRLKSAATEDNV